MAERYENRGRATRRLLWEVRSAEAEWNVPEGRVGSIVLQLRQRAHEANQRAQWLLWALLFIIFVGLIFFVLRPLLQDYSDGRREVFLDQIREGTTENATLDATRDSIQKRIEKAINPSFVKIKPDENEPIFDIEQLKGNAIVAISRNAVFTSPDFGESWNKVEIEDSADLRGLSVSRNKEFAFIRTVDNSVLRSTDGGNKWESVVNSNVKRIRPLRTHRTPFIYFDLGYGRLVYSDDAGKNWHDIEIPIKHPDGGSFRNRILNFDDHNLRMTISGRDIFKSDSKFSNFEKIPDADELLYAYDPPTIVAIKDDIPKKYFDFGLGVFSNIDYDSPPKADWRHASNGRVVGIGEGGEIVSFEFETGKYHIFGNDLSSNFQRLRYHQSERMLYAYTDSSGLYASKNDGVSWHAVGFFDDKPVSNISFLRHDGDIRNTTYVLTHSGLFRSEDGLKSWQRVGIPADFNTGSIIRFFRRTKSFAWSSYSFLVSNKSGSEFREFSVGLMDARVRSVMLSDDMSDVLVFSRGGDLFKISPSLSRQIRDLQAAPGATGDEALAQAVRSLPENVRFDPAIAFFESEISGLTRNREFANQKVEKANEFLNDISDGTYSVDQRISSFARFLRACVTGAPEVGDLARPLESKAYNDAKPEVLGKCIDGYASIVPSKSQQQWWIVLAEQVPFGILLLFLLATLATLYRYSLRLAAFHNARADALELLSADKSVEAFEKFADALAADKVEFGKANTPADQAVEIAKTVLNKTR